MSGKFDLDITVPGEGLNKLGVCLLLMGFKQGSAVVYQVRPTVTWELYFPGFI